MDALDLRPPCAGDDAVDDRMFLAIKNSLIAGSPTAFESAAEEILGILPHDEPTSNEARSFCGVCLDMAEQIPYNSSTMIDLVAFVQRVLDSPSFVTDDPKRPWRRIEAIVWESTDADVYGGGLEGDDLAKCVNFHAFQAHLYKRGMIDGVIAPIWTIRGALEGPFTETHHNVGRPFDRRTREAYVMAATQYILLFGEEILDQLLNAPRMELTAVFAGPLLEGKDPLSLDRWQFWRESFRAIAAGKWDEGEKARISVECKALVAKAAEEMDVIEAKVGPSTRHPGDVFVPKDTEAAPMRALKPWTWRFGR